MRASQKLVGEPILDRTQSADIQPWEKKIGVEKRMRSEYPDWETGERKKSVTILECQFCKATNDSQCPDFQSTFSHCLALLYLTLLLSHSSRSFQFFLLFPSASLLLVWGFSSFKNSQIWNLKWLHTSFFTVIHFEHLFFFALPFFRLHWYTFELIRNFRSLEWVGNRIGKFHGKTEEWKEEKIHALWAFDFYWYELYRSLLFHLSGTAFLFLAKGSVSKWNIAQVVHFRWKIQNFRVKNLHK